MSSPSPASPAQLEAGISGTLSGTISLRSWFKPSDDMVSSIGNSGHRRKRSGAESLGNTPLGTGIRKGRQAARRGELVSKSTFLRAKKKPQPPKWLGKYLNYIHVATGQSSTGIETIAESRLPTSTQPGMGDA